MNYSFSVKAANKADAKAAAAEHFDNQVVASQPVHARDRDAVLANVEAVVDLLADDDGKDVQVSCNGYLSWSGEDPQFSTVSVAATASHVNRE